MDRNARNAQTFLPTPNATRVSSTMVDLIASSLFSTILLLWTVRRACRDSMVHLARRAAMSQTAFATTGSTAMGALFAYRHLQRTAWELAKHA
jgi:hypothetical protein